MATEHDHFAAERRRVKEAFEFFDREGRGLLVKEEVGTIMRYLGAFPSEDALVNEILPQVCCVFFFAYRSGFPRYAAFLSLFMRHSIVH